MPHTRQPTRYGDSPGAGPVGVKKALEPFLPVPMIEKKDDTFILDYRKPQTIGKVRSFYGNIPVLLRAAAYITALGGEGLKKASEQAVINANYLLSILKEKLPAPAGNRCMHEFVLSGKPLGQYGVKTLDLAKRLLDYGFQYYDGVKLYGAGQSVRVDDMRTVRWLPAQDWSAAAPGRMNRTPAIRPPGGITPSRRKKRPRSPSPRCISCRRWRGRRALRRVR